MSPQIVLMTGGSSGMGLALAEHLAKDPEQRFLVIATVISMAEKGDLVSAIGDALDKRIFIKEMDVTNDKHISDVVQSVIVEHGRVDILLNIAGVQVCGLVETIPRERLDLVLNVNTVGPIRLTQAVLPHMKRQKAGKIITVSSTAGRGGFPYGELYCASKFAVEGFFESLAHVARSFNIRICLVEPGPINTGLLDGIINDIAKVATDESADDIDRIHAPLWADAMKNKFPVMTTADVVATIMKCIDDKKPVLRHPVSEEMGRKLGAALSDYTGEAGLEGQKQISHVKCPMPE